MRSIGRALLGGILLLAAPAAWAAKPYTVKCPEEDRNVLAVRTLRALAGERCDCAAAPSHGAHVTCVAREVKAIAAARGDTRACRRVAVTFERRSLCGRPASTICCRATQTGGVETTMTDAARCAQRGGAACACGDATGSLCAHSLHDACTAAATCTAADDDGDPGIVHSHLLPSKELLLSWIEDIVAQGIRRPGYPADDWTIDWAAERFADLGLDVRLDPISVQRWQPNRCALAVWPQASPEARESIPCFAVPYSTPTAGLVAPLASFTEGADLSGRIAVVDNTFLRLPQTVMVALFATDYYDPLGEFATLAQTLPFSSRFQDVMEPAIAAGAAGFIGILDGLPWETDQYYVPYDALQRPIPGVWLSQSNGARLRALLAAGPVDGEVIVEAEVAPTPSYNVIGTLPGASPEWVIIGSHHDGPWASAVEDASGTAMVLGQALYWSQVPAAERPHNLLFLLNGGHMTGGAGLIDFVTRNADWLDEVVLEVHLEHIAREGRGEEGRLVPTDRPEVRWWFTTEIPPLQAAVKQAIVRENLDRSLIIPPDGFPPGSATPPTDGAFFHPAVPMVNLLAAPMYLFDAADTLEMIHEESLMPASRAAARIVGWTRGQTAAGMRAGALP